MSDPGLTGRRVLIVEDEYLVAMVLADELADHGVEVIGPAPSVQHALTLVRSAAGIDVAVLDVNLGGELVYPVADALSDKGVPFILMTGYDRDAIPDRYRQTPTLQKPVPSTVALTAIRTLLGEPTA